MRTREPRTAKKHVAPSVETVFQRATLRFMISELESAIHFCKLAQSSATYRERWVHSAVRSRDLAEKCQLCSLLNYMQRRRVARQSETLEKLFHQLTSKNELR
jgi:hypothetical protein